MSPGRLPAHVGWVPSQTRSALRPACVRCRATHDATQRALRAAVIARPCVCGRQAGRTAAAGSIWVRTGCSSYIVHRNDRWVLRGATTRCGNRRPGGPVAATSHTIPHVSRPGKKKPYGANGPYFFYWLSVFPCTVAFDCTNFQVNRLRTDKVSPSNVISHGCYSRACG